MDNVVMGGMRRQNNITDILRVDGEHQYSALRRTNGGDRVSFRRTNAANTLHNHPRTRGSRFFNLSSRPAAMRRRPPDCRRRSQFRSQCVRTVIRVTDQ